MLLLWCLGSVSSGEFLGNCMKLLLSRLSEDISGVDNLLENLAVSGLHVSKESRLEGLDVLNINTITVSLDTYKERGNNLLGLVWLILSLLEKLVKTDSTVKLLLGGRVKIGTEFGESSDLTVLSKLELHGTSNGLGGLVLGGGTDTGHRETDGNSRALTLVKELGLKENLSIGNRNHICRNVSGHITGLGLNDGKGSEGSSSKTAVHLGSTLKET
mmetsp:Transcript_12568/g.16807  ORF Transcript_12568/g.16807 Transcript_12568/m.16807 type:complete len:216 (+) Transcript_12568:193-840(+)